MALILPVNGIHPRMGADCYLADNATVVGDVVMGDRCSVWFHAVVRGDVHSIRIGDKVNIQDGAIIHCTYQKAATVIGSRVNIGHRAIVHGCTLEDDVLIGMGAIIMDHAVVRRHVVVGAGALVLEHSVLESGFVYAGTPARKIRALTQEQRQLLDELPDRYILYASWFS